MLCFLVLICQIICQISGYTAWAAPLQSEPPSHTAPIKGKAGQKGWLLKQNSSALGKLTIEIAPSSFRLQNDRAGTVTYAAAPDWQVTTYNTARKIYYSLPPQKFTGRFAMWSGTLNRHNLTAIRFVKGNSAAYKGTVALDFSAANDRANQKKQSEEQIWGPHIKVIEDPTLPQTALAIICKLYFLPPLGGLPVDCRAGVESSSSSINRKLKSVLETTTLEHKIIVPEQFLHPDLRGYKRLNDEVAFANANNGGSVDLKDFTDYMGN